MPVEIDEIRTQLTVAGQAGYEAAMRAASDVIHLLGIRALLASESTHVMTSATEGHTAAVAKGLGGLVAYTAAQRAAAHAEAVRLEGLLGANAAAAAESERMTENAVAARADANALREAADAALESALAATANRAALMADAEAMERRAIAASADAASLEVEARAANASFAANARETMSQFVSAEAADAHAAANSRAAVSAYLMSAASNALTALLIVETAMFAAAAAEAALLAYALKECIGNAAEFEESMSEVRIKLSATSDEMERLEGLAQSNTMSNLGKSAIDVAQGYAAIADDVRNAAEMQQMMIPIARLSVATNMEMVDASGLMITVLEQWNLTAADSTYVADQLVGAWTKTGLKGDELAAVYEKMGNVAAKLGWTIADVALVSEELADQLGGPEQVGTKLAMVMQKMASPTDAVSEAFAKAGLNINEAMQHAGSASEMIAWLQTGMWTLADATDAFGRRAATAFLALLNIDASKLADAEVAAGKAGEAARVAQEKMTEWKNEVKALKAAITDLAISGGESVMSLSKTWLTALTAVVNGMKLLITQGHDVTNQQQADSAAQQQAVVNAANAIINVMQTAGEAAIRFTYAFMSNLSSLSFFSAEMHSLAVAILEVAYATTWLNFGAWGPVRDNMLATISGMLDAEKKAVSSSYDWAVKFANIMPDDADTQVASFKAMMDKIRASIPNVVQEMFKPADTTPAPSLNGPTRPATLQSNEVDQIQKNVDALDEYLKKLKEAYEVADAGALDEVTKAQIKQAYNERRIAALVQEKQQVLALIAAYDAIPADVMRGKTEAEQEELQNQRADAMQKLNDQQKSLDQQIHDAQVEQIQARTDLQKKLLELNEKEREKSAEHMDKMIKRSQELNDHLNKSVQLVIGGQLSKMVTDQVDRLTGAGMDKDRNFLRGVSAQGNNRIVLDLNFTGPISEEMKSEMSSWLVGNIRQSTTTPSFAR